MPPSADKAVFEDLVDRHGAQVLNLLRRLCGNAADADDVFQETALRVWRNLHHRPLLRNPRAWLMTIAYHAFADHHARRPKHEPLLEHADPRAAHPLSALELAEQHARVGTLLEELPEPVRAVVALHYAGGLTLRQTARVLDISTGTAKSRLNSALVRLRKQMP